MRILLVEDSERLRRFVQTALKRTGYAVDVTGNGQEGLWLAESNPYDVVILDIMLPDLDGLTVLERLRAQGHTTHVLILTARDALNDRVKGLRTGADDYLVKPFALEELLARVEALCRRNYSHKTPVLKVADLEIDQINRTARCGGQVIELTPREFRLLEFLMMKRGQLVSRNEIEQHLYEESADLLSNTVDSAVCSLRKKLSGHGVPPLIQTRYGHGYLLKENGS